MERAALGFRLKASHALVRSEELGVRSSAAAQKIMKRREYIWGDARKSYEMTLFSYRQPSPRGEGAPKGRIGHKRYEKEWERASQADDLRKNPSAADAVPLPHAGNAIKLSGRSFLAPHRGSCPKGEASRYGANIFLNLIALPMRGRLIGGGFAAIYMG